MMAVSEQRLLDAIRRNEFESFARAAFHIVAPGERLDWNWHLDAICHHLELVRSGRIKRLIIEVPPRSLKSFLASIAFPAFLLGRTPSTKIITASYAMELAIKHANDFRVLMRSSWYRSLFPELGSGFPKDSETEFTTLRRGSRYSTSVGGSLTGRGADVIIIDDPMKAVDAMSRTVRSSTQEWARNTLASRLNSKLDGAIVLVMQRLHLDDLAGFYRDQGGWAVLSLPAIAQVDEQVPIGNGRWHFRQRGDLLHPQREPKGVLDQLRAALGSRDFSAQYLQSPVPVEGELVRWEWFKPFKELPSGEPRIVQSWDVAVKSDQLNDYSVCTTWAMLRDNYYLLDVCRARLAFPDLKRKVIDLARRWDANRLIIEDKGSGTALIQQLRSERLRYVPYPTEFQPFVDKVSRMSGETAVIEAGRVFYQAGAPWIDALRNELVQFPGGRYDDQVDSISQFLIWARTMSGPSIGEIRVR